MAPCPVPTSHRPDLLSGLSSCAEGGARRHALVTAGFAVLGPTGDAESRPRLVEALTLLIRRGLIAFGSTTLAFAALDLWQSRFLRQTSWDPRRLPAVVRLEDRVSRLDSLIQLVLVSAGLVWLLLVPFFPILILGGAARVLELTSIWSVVYAPMVVLTAAQVVFHAMNYMRPYWTPARSVARILLRLGTLLLWVTLLTADAWVAANAARRRQVFLPSSRLSRPSTSAAELR